MCLLFPHLQDLSVLCAFCEINPNKNLASLPALNNVDDVLGQEDGESDKGHELGVSESRDGGCEFSNSERGDDLRRDMGSVDNKGRGNLRKIPFDWGGIKMHKIQSHEE